ncbi:MAG: S41 family peptidase [Ferruginibacter sp.]
MSTIKNLFTLLILGGIGIFSSCQKGDDLVASAPALATPVITPVSAVVLKDSALLISKDIYLWADQLPASLNAQNYADLGKVMEAIRPYSIEPGFTQPVDRWSFAMKKTEWDQISGGMGSTFGTTSGTAGDFGMTVFFRAEGDLRVRLVEPNSPSGLVGIRRGWRITQINGNSNIATSNADFIINNVYNATTSSITFQKPDGSFTTLTLTAGHYTEKPVYLDTVYNINNTKIGYLVFNSFLGNQSQIQAEFARVFSNFSSQGVTKVIVDLRYNGGGYVDLQSKLANYLVNSSANGQLMMKQVYNNKNAQNNRTTNFQKAGNLNLNDVYFIVGRSTASASELLINNLKPYMEVKLVGGTTHGKPVGFFPIPVGDWYIFPVSFRTTNKNNEGNYFNGFPVNAQVADGLDKDWGDTNETSLASVIRNITTGSYAREAQYTESASVAAGNDKLEESLLKLTVDTRKVL